MDRKTIFLIVLSLLLLGAIWVYAQGIQIQQIPQTVEPTTTTVQPSVGTVLTQVPKQQPTSYTSLISLSPDTFVSVKDHGDSQTVMIYKVDDQGKVRLTHKAKFFY
ncbi:MAG: hypothetical protein N2746_04920 [Deltaproteobacteria bacterium]|nr:hypothetical protein [Deltaproteobacteria bacterium]